MVQVCCHPLIQGSDSMADPQNLVISCSFTSSVLWCVTLFRPNYGCEHLYYEHIVFIALFTCLCVVSFVPVCYRSVKLNTFFWITFSRIATFFFVFFFPSPFVFFLSYIWLNVFYKHVVYHLW